MDGMHELLNRLKNEAYKKYVWNRRIRTETSNIPIASTWKVKRNESWSKAFSHWFMDVENNFFFHIQGKGQSNIDDIF